MKKSILSDALLAGKVFQKKLRIMQIPQLFNYLPEVCFVVKDCDGRVMLANDVAARLCGFEHEAEMIGKTDYDLFAKDRADAYEKLRPYAEMNEVLDYVRRNHGQSIKVGELAQIAHLSPSQFDRRFLKVFHITPTKHILNVRIRSACNLLAKSHNTIASVALDAGFYDHSHFVRSFKKVVGLSPSAYRKQRAE